MGDSDKFEWDTIFETCLKPAIVASMNHFGRSLLPIATTRVDAHFERGGVNPDGDSSGE